MERLPRYPVEGYRRLERVHLPAERVAPDRHVDRAEGLLVGAAVEDLGGEHDHAGAGAVRRHAVRDPLADRVGEPELDRQLADRGRLPARDDERVDVVELGGTAYRPGDRVALGQRVQVLAYVALEGEYADNEAGHQ